MTGYEYKDQHFSVEIAEALISERNSTGVKIKTVEDKVLDSHTQRGGFGPQKGVPSDLIINKALRNLASVAKASEVYPFTWRYAKPDQWIFGEGKHWVYLYYFPQDKQDAEPKAKRQSIWQCKIGRANGVNKKGRRVYDAPERRVKSQTSGCPKTPIIGLLFRTNRHVALEKAIHGILTVRGQDIPQNQGTEWFMTNPCEVVEIVAQIDYGLLSPVNNLSAALFGMERKVLR